METNTVKKGSSIVSAIHHLKLSVEYMDDFMRDRPTAAITRLFKNYKGKIAWMLNDLKSEPLLPQMIRDGINQELNSDLLAVPAITEKIALLPPQQREMIELVIDKILAGEELQVVENEII